VNRVGSGNHAATRAMTGIALVVLLAACGARDKPVEPIRPVQLTQVKVGAAASTAVFAGEVRPRFEADLAFRIGGKIVERYVDTGARVKKGQVLARLDPADVGLQADAARAQVAAAETEFRFAQAEFDRYQGLLQEKFVSASALDAKRNALDANRAKYAQAKANLAVAQNQASYATLVASDDGVITGVTADAGQVVAAGAPVMKLARTGEREVLISVPENRINEVIGAQQLVVALWANPQKTYPARVREISPAVDPATRTFAVRVSIGEPDASVQLGMTANVGVLGADKGSSALLPLASIYQLDGRPAVWQFDPATKAVRLVPVVIGQYREDGVVVTSGVAQDAWIVAAGVHKLTPGQVVRPYGAGPAASATAATAPTAAAPAPPQPASGN
jgi:multidrug efflux system membrane fusion protein